MATYATTIRFTAEGMRQIGRTTERAAAFQETARELGVNIVHQLWTTGEFDGLIVFEAADDPTATKLMLQLSSLGYVRTTTCRAYTAAEMTDLLSGL